MPRNYLFPLMALTAGFAVGFVLFNKPSRPRIDVPYSVPIGQTYSIRLSNFPPFKQLVAPRNLSVAGGDLVNLGITDSNGTLTLNGNTAVGPAGGYYIVAWDAMTGQSCAMATLIVT